MYKVYADLMMKQASHVAKKSIIIIRLQVARERKKRDKKQAKIRAEEINESPKINTNESNENV